MGMFDYVNVEIPCPSCGSMVKSFQSKDYYCTMDNVDPIHVNSFRGSCACGKQMIFSKEVLTKREVPYSIEEVLDLGFKLLE